MRSRRIASIALAVALLALGVYANLGWDRPSVVVANLAWDHSR